MVYFGYFKIKLDENIRQEPRIIYSDNLLKSEMTEEECI
jgi:hypothetical protein